MAGWLAGWLCVVYANFTCFYRIHLRTVFLPLKCICPSGRPLCYSQFELKVLYVLLLCVFFISLLLLSVFLVFLIAVASLFFPSVRLVICVFFQLFFAYFFLENILCLCSDWSPLIYFRRFVILWRMHFFFCCVLLCKCIQCIRRLVFCISFFRCILLCTTILKIQLTIYKWKTVS